MSFTQIAIYALAVWQSIDVIHHSRLFAGLRSNAEARGGWFAYLVQCPWCMSVQHGLLFAFLGSLMSALAFFTRLPSISMALNQAVVWLWFWEICTVIVGVFHWFVYGLAIAKLANLGNDLSYNYCRLPRQNKLPPSGEPQAGGGIPTNEELMS